MRLYELYHPPEIIINLIREQCSDYLSEVKKSNKCLYRGLVKKKSQCVVNFQQDYYINLAPRNRKNYNDGNDHMVIEQVIDNYLKKIKIKALRTKSVFVTTEVSQAMDYGELFLIFPKNGFSYCYGNNFDIYPEIEDWLGYEASSAATTGGYSKRMVSFLDDCHSDLGIFSRYLERSSIMRWLFTNLFLEQYGFTNEDLGYGMRKGYEIWFNGHYHAVLYDSELGTKCLGELF